MSFTCLIYHGKATDHEDTSVRRGVRPGVTAVQLRLHPGLAPELSVEKKMSTVFVFVVKIGGRKYHELAGVLSEYPQPLSIKVVPSPSTILT